jgi:AraC-like DNA-binding protein
MSLAEDFSKPKPLASCAEREHPCSVETRMDNRAQREPTMVPAEGEADRLSFVSDIREILRPAALPNVAPDESTLIPSTDISVDEAPLTGTRELTGENLHRLVLVLGGRVQIETDDLSVPVESGEAMWLGPCSRVALSASEPARLCIVSSSWIVSLPRHAEPVRDAAGRLREIAQWLTMELRADFDGAEEYRATLLRLLAGEWLRLNSDDMCVLEKRLRAYVLEHIEEPISLEVVARHVGVGRYHLCRKYRRATGQSPMHAVRTVRLERARELLATTKLPLRVVAKKVGLSSEQHLSRLLRSHFQVGVRDIRQRAGQ